LAGLSESTVLEPVSIPSPAAFQAAFDVSRETVEALEIYADFLRRWQRTINLVAPKTLPDLWHRHFADSAQVLDVWRATRPVGVGPVHWLDLGSGAGFPGLVVGLVAKPGEIGRLTLIESDERKAAFLREVARATGLKDRLAVDIVVARIESPANHLKVQGVDVVSARALAPLPKLLDWSLPYFGPTTRGLFLKGRDAAAEIAAVPALAGVMFSMVPSRTEPEAAIVVVQRTSGEAGS
jgi:16S rRNA (guanine527-N7)-methyltransferase